MASPAPLTSITSRSISSSIRLTNSDRRSNSSRLRRTGSRRWNCPSMMRLQARRTASTRRSVPMLTRAPPTRAKTAAGTTAMTMARVTISSISRRSLVARPRKSVEPSGSSTETAPDVEWLDTAALPDPVHRHFGDPIDRRQRRREAGDVAGQARAVGGEQPVGLAPARVDREALVQPDDENAAAFRGERLRFEHEARFDPLREVADRLPIEEGTHDHDGQGHDAGGTQGPAERGRLEDGQSAHRLRLQGRSSGRDGSAVLRTNPVPRTVWISCGSPGASTLRRSLPIWTSTRLVPGSKR